MGVVATDRRRDVVLGYGAAGVVMHYRAGSVVVVVGGQQQGAWWAPYRAMVICVGVMYTTVMVAPTSLRASFRVSTVCAGCQCMSLWVATMGPFCRGCSWF